MPSSLKRAPWIVVIFLVLFLLSLPFAWSLWQKHNPFYGKWEENIAYYNASDYDRTLKEAIQRWEATGLPIGFREVDTPGEADLLIYSSEEELRKKCRRCSGYASIGDNILKTARIDLLPPINRFEGEIVDLLRMKTVIHELGHVLGLKHSTQGCSVMNVGSFCNNLGQRIHYDPSGPRVFCGPWPGDLKALGELYGFEPREISPNCQHKSKKEQLIFQQGDTLIPLEARLDYIERRLGHLSAFGAGNNLRSLKRMKKILMQEDLPGLTQEVSPGRK